jgi:hypothetical protein
VDGGAVIYHQLHQGIGVFEVNKDEPTPLKELWPKMQEPELERRHQARIAPIEAKERNAGYWGIGGLVVGGVGIGADIA